MSHGDYSTVVELLTPVKPEPEAASLTFLLEDARSRMQSIQHHIDAALHAAGALANHEQYAEAVQFLETQSPTVTGTEPVQKALANLRQASENELSALKAVGSAYAALDGADVALSALQNPGNNMESSLLARLVPVFASRRKTVADLRLSSAIEQARAAINAGDRKEAAKVLESVVALSEFASSGIHEEWQALNKKASKGRVFRK